MALVTKSLLKAIRTEILTGAYFTDIEECYIIQALQEEYIPQLATAPPFALVYPASGTTLVNNSLRCVSSETVDLIGLSIFDEYWGENIGMIGNDDDKIGATDRANAIMTAFHHNTLSVAVAGHVISIDYSPMGFITYEEQGLAQVHATLQYDDEYFR